MAKRLYDDLSQELFENKTVEVVELTRHICDLKSMGEQIQMKGSIVVATLLADTFVKSSKKITDTLHEIPEDILRENFRTLIKALETHLQSKQQQTSSKELIKDFLNSEKNLYKGVEVTLQAVCAAAVKVSVESDVESLVSRYEKHLKADRQMNEDNAEEEMEIAENGPLLVHADNLLNKAMNKYWNNSEWHFIKTKTEGLFIIQYK